MREKSWRSGYGAWRRAGLIDTFGAREDEGVSGMTSRARRVRVVFQVRAETARADAVYPIVHVRDALPAPGPCELRLCVHFLFFERYGFNW